VDYNYLELLESFTIWNLQQLLEAMMKNMSSTPRLKYFVLILTILCLATACATPPPISIDEALTAEKEEKLLWRRAQEEQQVINDSGWLYRDPELETYLNQVAAKLKAFTDSPDILFDIKIINDPNLNAFAFPNGVIYVHTGVLARMENEAQLAALLAHEMTHCTHRHSLRVLKSIKDQAGYMAAVQKTIEKVVIAQDLARFLGVNGSMAAVSGYTREFEAEADRVGLDLMAKAGYDPRQALNLFEHLQQEIVIEGIKEPFFLGTHPSVQQRMENVSQWLATDYSGNIGLINSEIFRSRLDKLVLDNARLDLRIGRFYAARRSVQKYLHRNQDDAGAYYLLGEIFRQQGQQDDMKKAIKLYERAIALDPSFPAPHKAMGLMHYKEGERRLAQKFFEACLLLSPNAPDNAYIQGYLQRCINSGEES
jgi:Zn-dependent protease with chaperone function